jgi:hypothetical protein
MSRNLQKTGEAWYQYRGLVHRDFRRSAVRNLVNSGVDTAAAIEAVLCGKWLVVQAESSNSAAYRSFSNT